VSGQLHALAALPGIGRWVGPRTSLDESAKRENDVIAPAGNRTPVVQPVA